MHTLFMQINVWKIYRLCLGMFAWYLGDVQKEPHFDFGL